jgi:hypothetical protein
VRSDRAPSNPVRFEASESPKKGDFVDPSHEIVVWEKIGRVFIEAIGTDSASFAAGMTTFLTREPTETRLMSCRTS